MHTRDPKWNQQGVCVQQFKKEVMYLRRSKAGRQSMRGLVGTRKKEGGDVIIF